MPENKIKEGKRVLHLESLSAGYNDTVVLEDVNLSVYEGDFVGLIGANGSGKTTLLKVLLGLIQPLRGKVHYHFDGEGSPRKYIGYMPQASMFDKQFPIRVVDVVLSGLIAKMGLFKHFTRKQRDRGTEVLEQMGVAHLGNNALGELSGGQMQRVFLARALISSPKLLVLDEPNTFVDKNFETSFYEILKELNKTVTILLVSHDVGMISSYVKSIACCVNHHLHYHESSELSQELLHSYPCPIDLITHGDLPHRVLKNHTNCKICNRELSPEELKHHV